MKVQCPACEWSTDVPDEQIPVGGRNAKCPNCSTKFYVAKEIVPPPDFVFEPLNRKSEDAHVHKASKNHSRKPDTQVNRAPDKLPSPATQSSFITEKIKNIGIGIAISVIVVLSAGSYSKFFLKAKENPQKQVITEVNTGPVASEQKTAASGESTTNQATDKSGRDGGLVVTLESWGESQSLPMRRGETIQAKEGAKFVWVKIKFQNDGKESVDIHCNYHLGSALFDKERRKFDSIGTRYLIDGNTECNENIQPGFSSHETFAFEIPAKFTPDYVKFWDTRENLGGGQIDSSGEKSSIQLKLQ